MSLLRIAHRMPLPAPQQLPWEEEYDSPLTNQPDLFPHQATATCCLWSSTAQRRGGAALRQRAEGAAAADQGAPGRSGGISGGTQAVRCGTQASAVADRSGGESGKAIPTPLQGRKLGLMLASPCAGVAHARFPSFSQGRPLLVSGGNDGRVLLWDWAGVSDALGGRAEAKKPKGAAAASSAGGSSAPVARVVTEAGHGRKARRRHCAEAPRVCTPHGQVMPSLIGHGHE